MNADSQGQISSLLTKGSTHAKKNIESAYSDPRTRTAERISKHTAPHTSLFLTSS